MQITPAILPENFEQVLEKLFILEGVAKRVQIDLCDGIFGLEKTWLPYKEDFLPEGFEYEFDLMVKDWRKYLPRVISLGAERVVLHVDEFEERELDELVEIAESHRIRLGLSVSNGVDARLFARQVERVLKRYHKVFIQVMGITKIGAQGQPFDRECIERIKYFHREFRNVQIQVDGSMNPETMMQVKNAGAVCAVVGSYIFKGDPIKKLLMLENDFR